MSKSPVSNDVALRIALAARALPDTDAARLLHVLDDAMGLPPTKAKLAKLNFKILKAAADGELAEIDAEFLKQAVSILKGEDAVEIEEDMPKAEPYREGDIPDSIRVACASNSADNLDGHFGSCRRFLIYQMNEAELRLVDVRDIQGDAEADDKNAFRAGMIKDCQVLFVSSIGGPAAAKVVKAGVHPIKQPAGGNARDMLIELQKVIAVSPPPWLAKVMGREAEQRVRFERHEAEV